MTGDERKRYAQVARRLAESKSLATHEAIVTERARAERYRLALERIAEVLASTKEPGALAAEIAAIAREALDSPPYASSE